MENNNDMNYKQAYYYLFNQITNIISWLKFTQINAETICVDLMPEEKIKDDTSKMLEYLINGIKKELEDDTDTEDDNE